MKLTPHLTVLALCALACDGSKPSSSSPPPAPQQPAIVSVDASLAGDVVRGVIEWVGAAPPRVPIVMSGTAGCPGHSDALSETAIVRDGKLANVFVYVKAGLPKDASWPVPEQPVALDQKGCLYVPHVLGVRVGQKLLVGNGDPATHNVNAKPGRNEGFNRMHAPGAPALEIVYASPEIGVPFKCDIHPWMSAWVHVVEHPFFAVSAPDGSFELRGLPPGKYKLEAVHEWAGRQSFEVELGPAGGASARLSFQAPARR